MYTRALFSKYKKKKKKHLPCLYTYFILLSYFKLLSISDGNSEGEQGSRSSDGQDGGREHTDQEDHEDSADSLSTVNEGANLLASRAREELGQDRAALQSRSTGQAKKQSAPKKGKGK